MLAEQVQLEAPHRLMRPALRHLPAPEEVRNPRALEARDLLIVHDLEGVRCGARQNVILVVQTLNERRPPTHTYTHPNTHTRTHAHAHTRTPESVRPKAQHNKTKQNKTKQNKTKTRRWKTRYHQRNSEGAMLRLWIYRYEGVVYSRGPTRCRQR